MTDENNTKVLNFTAKSLYCFSFLEIKAHSERFEKSMLITDGKWEAFERNNSIVIQAVGTDGISDWWVECNGVTTDSGIILSSEKNPDESVVTLTKKTSSYELFGDGLRVNCQVGANSLACVDYHFKKSKKGLELIRILIQKPITDCDTYGVPVYTPNYIAKSNKEERTKREKEKYGVRPLFKFSCCKKDWESIYSSEDCNKCNTLTKGVKIPSRRVAP